MDLRSAIVILRVLGEFLVDPTLPVTAPPDLPVHEPSRYRSPWEDDLPKVPYARPRRSLLQRIVNIIVRVDDHAV